MSKTLGDMIKAWNEKGRPYDVGLDLYLRYGPRNANIMRMLQSPRRNRHQEERLAWELEKMAADMAYAIPPQPAEVKRIIEMPAERPKDRAALIVQETIGEARKIETEDELVAKLRKLYTRRAKLSNALVIDEGDEKKREANNELLDQLEVIMKEMKAIEAERRDRKINGEARKTKMGIVLNFRGGKETYTMEELLAMTPEQKKAALKRAKKERQWAITSQKRVQKPEFVAGNKRKEEEMDAAIKLIQRVMLEMS